MSVDLVQLNAKVDEVLRRLQFIGEPDLTISAFAKRAGRSRTTIHEHIRDHRLLTRDGRVPVSELSKYTS